MRRCIKLAQVAQQTGALSLEGAQSGASVQAMLNITRGFGAPAAPPGEPTQMQKTMVNIATLPRKVVHGAISSGMNAVSSLATGDMAKSLVTSFAENVIVGEKIVNLKDVDVPFWSYWLSTAGYSNVAGFKKMAEAVKPKIASMSAADVSDLGIAFHKVNCYDRELFDAIAASIKDKFTEYETESLLKLVSAFADFGHYDPQLFDDVADSITYCNHFLAPSKCSPVDIANTFAAYAKYKHERGDLFVTLARGVYELNLPKLSPQEIRDVSMKMLSSFETFWFWPDTTELLIVMGEARPDAFSVADKKELERYLEHAEMHTASKLTYARGGWKDSHWYDDASKYPELQDYNLTVFRPELVPKMYSPVSVKAVESA